MQKEDEITVEHQFDTLCKKAMVGEAKTCKIENAKRSEKQQLGEVDINIPHYDFYLINNNVIHYRSEVFVFKNDLLYEAVEHLHEEKRNIILLFYFLEMTDEEIAKALKAIRRTVNYKRNRALQELKKYMEEINEKI